MISSMYGHLMKVVALNLIKNVCGSELHSLIQKVFVLVNDSEFRVVIIITDNNRNMFKILTHL